MKSNNKNIIIVTLATLSWGCAAEPTTSKTKLALSSADGNGEITLAKALQTEKDLNEKLKDQKKNYPFMLEEQRSINAAMCKKLFDVRMQCATSLRLAGVNELPGCVGNVEEGATVPMKFQVLLAAPPGTYRVSTEYGWETKPFSPTGGFVDVEWYNKNPQPTLAPRISLVRQWKLVSDGPDINLGNVGNFVMKVNNSILAQRSDLTPLQDAFKRLLIGTKTVDAFRASPSCKVTFEQIDQIVAAARAEAKTKTMNDSVETVTTSSATTAPSTTAPSSTTK